MPRVPVAFENHPTTFAEAMQEGKYRAVCERIIDGDTYDFTIDHGLNVYSYETIRLNGFDAPEIFHPQDAVERADGLIYKAYAEEMLDSAYCLLTTYKDKQTFGRYVADVDVYNFSDEAYFSMAAELERIRKNRTSNS